MGTVTKKLNSLKNTVVSSFQKEKNHNPGVVSYFVKFFLTHIISNMILYENILIIYLKSFKIFEGKNICEGIFEPTARKYALKLKN